MEKKDLIFGFEVTPFGQQEDPIFGFVVTPFDEDAPQEDTKVESPSRRRFLIKTAELATAAIGVAGLGIYTEIRRGRQIEVPLVTYNPEELFVSTAETTPLESPEPSISATPTESPKMSLAAKKEETPPSPTPEPTKAPKEIIGDKNAAEFFFGNLVELFKQARMHRFSSDPGYGQRVEQEHLTADTLNFIYLGIDQTRERAREFNGQGSGLADVIIFVSFNIHSFKTTVISLPRDMFVPELGQPGVRINTVTSGRSEKNSYELTRKIIESATGMPVDGIIKTNIDFMKGHHGESGILDNLFPQGLEITVPKRIYDPEYPVGYRKTVLDIPPGKHNMNGELAVKYARTRHADSDYGRSDRQRQILRSGMKQLLPQVMEDLIKGNTKTLDTVIETLDKQHTDKNLFFDVNIIEILKVVRTNLQNLRNSANGIAALAAIAANTTDEVSSILTDRKGVYTSFGLTSGNGSLDTYSGFITKVRGSPANPQQDPRTGNYLSYWGPIRRRIRQILQGSHEAFEASAPPLPNPEDRIHNPAELSKDEVQKWVEMGLRNTHDAVITESLFTKEFAAMTFEKRQKVLEAIARAHAQALYQHYGDTEAIVGLDPGHGGFDIGSSSKDIIEQRLTWELAQLTAQEIYNVTQGKYHAVILRPEHPTIANKDHHTYTKESIQWRKAQLLAFEEQNRPSEERGKNICYVSLHFNGSPDQSANGVEVYFPNPSAMTDETHRKSSEVLANILQQKLVAAVREAGYDVFDRKVKMDPAVGGAYLALDSPRLDQSLN